MTRFLFNVAVVLAIIFCGESAAQDSAAPNKKTGQKTSQQEISSAGEAKKENPTKKTGAEEFTDALNKWRNLHRQLQETKRQYQQAKLGDQKRLRDQYSNIITQIQLHLSTLRSAAITAYEEAPNKDENVYRLLIGMMADSNAKNMFEESLKIGRLLEKHDCPLDAYAGPLGVALFCGGDEGAAEKHLAKAKQTGKLTEFGKKVVREWELRGKEAEQKLPRVTLNTSKGKIEIVLFENEAPDTVGNFVQLVEKKFYDNLTFHRVIEGFMAQGGCPKGDGSGGPGYNIYCECDQPDHRLHFRGSLSMAHAGKDTGGSQFYIVYDRAGASHLDRRHTVFGRVVKGMDVADKLQPTGADTVKKEDYDRILTAAVDFKRDHPYLPKKSAEKSAEQGAEK